MDKKLAKKISPTHYAILGSCVMTQDGPVYNIISSFYLYFRKKSFLFYCYTTRKQKSYIQTVFGEQ